MLARALPLPCSGAGGRRAPAAGLAGGVRPPWGGAAGVRLVAAARPMSVVTVAAAAAGSWDRKAGRSEAVPAAAPADGKDDVLPVPTYHDTYFAITTGEVIFAQMAKTRIGVPVCNPGLKGLQTGTKDGFFSSAFLNKLMTSTVGKSTNIRWHDCPVNQVDRQKLLNQKGCVVWITGLSGSGKSTLACALSRELHSRGHLTYVLDGDNLRHGLNKDLSFKAEDRAENIRRVGEVAKLFADAGLICITSLISPYKSDRSACRKLLPNSSFIEVFLNVPLEVCEERDPKGLYKLARAGKIKGFTGIDDPYETPSDCEIVIQCKVGGCPSPKSMADQIVSYLEANEFLQN